MSPSLMKIRDMDKSPENREVWDEIVHASTEGWLWATYTMHKFRVSYAEARNCLICDRSFIVLCDDQPCGIVPLVFNRDEYGDIVASHFDAPLPWPMIRADAADRAEIETVMFDEIERRIAGEKAVALRFILSPPHRSDQLIGAFAKIVRERSFVDTSFQSHCITLTPNMLGSVRERYQRDVRKYSDAYEMSILDSTKCSDDLAQFYMDLHVADAGRVNRPLITYELQVDLVRNGEGFFVLAHKKDVGKIVGMLLVGVYKGAAYDSSVAVDPAFKREPVSHLMKWKALQHLAEIGVGHYELGMRAFTPSYLQQPSQKKYGISFFKDGWSRGLTKTVWLAEKFYSRAAFTKFWDERRECALNHFGIQE